MTLIACLEYTQLAAKDEELTQTSATANELQESLNESQKRHDDVLAECNRQYEAQLEEIRASHEEARNQGAASMHQSTEVSSYLLNIP